eukprot:8441905-Pyramimonas_sp.AAC.1
MARPAGVPPSGQMPATPGTSSASGGPHGIWAQSQPPWGPVPGKPPPKPDPRAIPPAEWAARLYAGGQQFSSPPAAAAATGIPVKPPPISLAGIP